MAVLLKNLVARAPRVEELTTVTQLIISCEDAGAGVVDDLLEDVRFYWHQPDFSLPRDAWVIVTTGGQMVGFACVWHQDHIQISTFICVHPAYRKRGIGTLLLRMAEMRARQHARLAQPGARVVLRGLISNANEGAQCLFQREGYQPGREFLRVASHLVEESSEPSIPGVQKELWVDNNLEYGYLQGATPLYDQDGLCSVCLYRTYEKELRPASVLSIEAGRAPDVFAPLVGMYAGSRAS